MAEEATYQTTTVDGEMRYVCLVCAGSGTDYYSRDFDLMCSHQAQRHGGQMVESKAPPEDHPHGGPPGQTGEHPDHPEHPHGAPPGQTGDHPHDEEPHPAHPIVEPEEGV